MGISLCPHVDATRTGVWIALTVYANYTESNQHGSLELTRIVRTAYNSSFTNGIPTVFVVLSKNEKKKKKKKKTRNFYTFHKMYINSWLQNIDASSPLKVTKPD